MPFPVRPEWSTASVGSSHAPTDAVDHSSPSAIRPESTYISGKVVQTNGATSQIRDLRREFASRLRESGASDHDVRDFLGHANITTTSRYLASTPLGLEQALANLEARNGRTLVAQTTDQPDNAPVVRSSEPIETRGNKVGAEGQN